MLLVRLPGSLDSALANRTIFVFWASAFAARLGAAAAAWPLGRVVAAGRRWGTLVLLAAAGLSAFALLERRPTTRSSTSASALSLYTEAATRPATALALAALLGLAGAVALLLPGGGRRVRAVVEERA